MYTFSHCQLSGLLLGVLCGIVSTVECRLDFYSDVFIRKKTIQTRAADNTKNIAAFGNLQENTNSHTHTNVRFCSFCKMNTAENHWLQIAGQVQPLKQEINPLTQTPSNGKICLLNIVYFDFTWKFYESIDTE